MKDDLKKSEIPKRLTEDHEDLTFPGRKSLLEKIQNNFDVKGDVWVHHAYHVASEDPLTLDNLNDVQYQDKVIVPSVLHTLIDKVGGKRTASIATISGLKKPELLLVYDPATMNIAIVSKERVWITEILLNQADFLFPTPYERTHALTSVDRTQIEVTKEDISIEINGFRAKGGIERDSILLPLDSYYSPVLGGKDHTKRLKSSLLRTPDVAELILMISDAISSSAKMYLGTVNTRLQEDRVSLEYPKEAHIAAIKIYNQFLDVIEIRSPSQPNHVELQRINFRIYRTEVSRSLRRLIKILHIR